MSSVAEKPSELEKLRSIVQDLKNGVDAPQYHSQGMGCGVEDRDLQTDGYGAAEYGWERAAERYAEWINNLLESV